MNQEKAKEFFSALYDGSIEPGLRQSLEQKLRTSRELNSEYAQFERTMEDLDALKFEQVEIPQDLHERITARIDLHLFEQRRAAPAGWSTWVRHLALGGVAAAAIVGTVLTLRSAPAGGASTANIGIPAPVAAGRMVVEATDRGAILEYAPAGAKHLSIRNGMDGPELSRIPLGAEAVRSPLVNPLPEAASMSIHEEGRTAFSLVALPGTRVDYRTADEGTLEDFAKAVAGRYRVPVIVLVANPAEPLAWTFSATDARQAASAALDSSRFSVEERKTGVIWIVDK